MKETHRHISKKTIIHIALLVCGVAMLIASLVHMYNLGCISDEFQYRSSYTELYSNIAWIVLFGNFLLVVALAFSKEVLSSLFIIIAMIVLSAFLLMSMPDYESLEAKINNSEHIFHSSQDYARLV